MQNSRVIKFIFLIILVLLVIFLNREFDLVNYLASAKIKEKIAEFGIWAPLAFMGIFILVTVAFLPVVPLDLVAGAIFGLFWGVVYVVIAATIGAVLAFGLTRSLGRAFVQQQLVNRFASLEHYDKKIDKHGFGLMLFLRLVPLFPFNGLNFAMGLTKIKFRDYLTATFLGIIPGAFAYVYFGDSLARMDIPNLIFAALLLVLLVSISPIYNLFRKKAKNEFDIIVIGAGAAGLNIANFMNKAGFKTLLIDKSANNIGGDCLNFGCIPSKTLVYLAKTIKSAYDASRYGLKVGGLSDIYKIKQHIKRVQEKIRKHENADYFRAQGIEVKLGRARFTAKNQVEVEGKKYQGDKLVIATGSRPKKLQVPGIEKVSIYSNETIFDIDRLPRKLLVVGAGPIGVELGQAFCRLGSEVTIVHRGERCLKRERADITAVLHRQLEKEGVRLCYNSEIKEFVSENRAILHNKLNGAEALVQFDAVLVAIGRELNLEGLGLDKAGVKIEKGKIKLDRYLRTTNRNILVAGDIAGGAMFTHATELHAAVILNNFFSPFKKKLDYRNFSWVTFTDPEIATFGLSQQQLQELGLSYRILRRDFNDDDRALTDNYPYSLAVLYLDTSNRILGGSMIAPRAGELVQELILAMSTGIKVNQIFAKIYPYPTATRINRVMISDLFAKKLRSKLTRRLLKFLYH